MSQSTSPHPSSPVSSSTTTPRPSFAALLHPGLVFGFGTAIAMWVIFFITHLPSLAIPAQISFALFILCICVGAFFAARSQTGIPGWLAGSTSAAISALVNVLLLGAFIVKQPPTADPASTVPASGTSGLHAESLMAMGGFFAACIVLGLVSGSIGGMGSALRSARVTARQHWLARFAILTSICFLPLLLIGGLVTTTGSGMSVRGWPDSFGANMFLYPISLMTSHQAVFLEHSHRLFGTFVGLTVVTLTAWVLLAKVSGGIGARVAGLLILVCIQGALGGFRVTENSLFLSMLHGVAGQLTFAAAILIMMLLLPSYETAATAIPDPDARKRKALATALLHSTILQLIMGAAYRHLRHADSPGANHALWAHMFFSLLVVGAGVMAATFARSRPGDQPHDRLMRGIGVATVACVAVQFLLGWLAFYFVHTGNSKGNIPMPEQLATAQSLRPTEVIFRTLHQGNGAILLALATMGLVLSKRIWKASVPNTIPSSSPLSATAV